MKAKFILPRLVMLVLFGLTVQSCTSNEDDMPTSNIAEVEINSDYYQKDGDTTTVNENEPVIVKPPR